MALGSMLAADSAKAEPALRTLFAADFTLHIANTVPKALAILDESFDVILCGVHFDDSRMFDMLRIAKADPRTRAVPFVCYRNLDTDLGPTVVEGLEISTKALGAAMFVDFCTLKRRLGVPSADAHFRDLVLAVAQGTRL